MSSTTATPANDVVVAPANDVVVLHRRRIDRVLVALGLLTAIVLLVAGLLLNWGRSFAADYVGRELTSQHIAFPAADALKSEAAAETKPELAAKVNALVSVAGKQVTTGDLAEKYANYIGVHLDGVADGKTYADLGAPQSALRTQIADAKTANKAQTEIDALQAQLDTISGQRDTLFKGETLRGLLLSTYAWDTIGTIAGIAAVVAFIATAIMLLLVVSGFIHLRRA